MQIEVDLTFIDRLMNSQPPGLSYDVVLLNYQLPSWWENALQYAENIIVADGGAQQFVNKKGEYTAKTQIIGDLDSITAETVQILKQQGYIVECVPDQDTTDCEKALARLKSDRILILGALGGRMDHTFYNIGLCAKSTSTIYLVNKQNVAICGSNIKIVVPTASVNVGIFPLKGKTNVKTCGLQWEISGDLEFGGSLSVSNKVTEDQFVVSSEKPVLIIITGKFQ